LWIKYISAKTISPSRAPFWQCACNLHLTIAHTFALLCHSNSIKQPSKTHASFASISRHSQVRRRSCTCNMQNPPCSNQLQSNVYFILLYRIWVILELELNKRSRRKHISWKVKHLNDFHVLLEPLLVAKGQHPLNAFALHNNISREWINRSSKQIHQVSVH